MILLKLRCFLHVFHRISFSTSILGWNFISFLVFKISIFATWGPRSLVERIARMRRKTVVQDLSTGGEFAFPASTAQWCLPFLEVKKWVPPIVVVTFQKTFSTSMIMGEKGKKRKPNQTASVFYTLYVENAKFTAKGRTAMNCLKFGVGCY